MGKVLDALKGEKVHVYIYKKATIYTYMYIYSTGHRNLYTIKKYVRATSAHHASGEAPFLEYECSRDQVLFEYGLEYSTNRC